MSADVKIVLDELTPSLNKTLRAHWRTRRSQKELWKEMLAVLIFHTNRTQKFQVDRDAPYRNVTIERYSLKTLDYDNFVGGCKEVIVDVLVSMRLIEDDTPEAVQINYVQHKVDKVYEKKTVITLHST